MRRRRSKKKGGPERQALGRSKGGFTTKIHAVVDALGNPLEFVLTAGQVHDSTQAAILVAPYPAEAVIADKAYDSEQFISLLHDLNILAVIPNRKNRKEPRAFDACRYKERHLVECLFNKLKYFRRVFSRFDKFAKRYMSFLQFAASILWLK